MKYFMVILVASTYLPGLAGEHETEQSAKYKTMKYRDFILAMKIMEKIERDEAIKEITSQLPKEIVKIIQSYDAP